MRVARALASGIALIGAMAGSVPAFASEPSQLPHWSDAPPLPPPPPPIQVPRDGRGAVTFGSMLLLGGAAATGLGIYTFVDGRPGWGATGTVLGIVSIGVGIGTTVVGAGRQRRYREWQITSRLRPPEQGRGLLAAGAATMIGSVAVFAASGFHWLSDYEATWIPVTGFTLGATGMVLGSLFLIAGSSYDADFDRWRARKARVLPTAAFGPQGMQLGLTGRF